MHNYVSRFRLPNGKWTYIQRDENSKLAKLQVQRIRKLWRCPKYYFHLRSGGHIASLKMRLVNTCFGIIDLTNFFGSIRRNRITRCLKRIGYSFRDAEEFAVSSTVYLGGSFVLPFGFTQSPILASIALDKSALGRCLDLVQEQGINASVYVDDIIISANKEDKIRSAIEQIHHSASRSGFLVNSDKSMGPSSSIQAFNILVSSGNMEITQNRFDEMCRFVLQNGSGFTSTGILSYVKSVNRDQASQMRSNFPRSFL